MVYTNLKGKPFNEAHLQIPTPHAFANPNSGAVTQVLNSIQVSNDLLLLFLITD